MSGLKLGFVVGEFNADITHLMMERARAHAEFLDCEVTHIIRVPGAFDAPLAIKKMIERSDVDAVVTLGAVIEGDTEHDQVVAQHAARKMMDLALEHGKPVSLGISGPGMTRAQGQARIDEYARRSVEAAVKLARRTRELGKKDAPAVIG
ncbi:MAG: 6,7-dimethyl-8-ribityllumazine synthase [Candidatus Altiarchaeales archaeon]|nr:6,7-dimethyl-8-ribityllumazine synthase [Candidatus Altiarchaeales archaeon]MBD3417053.1 6,7-dimethyl-8-ribityllumazine synthase [Candidatus Altiarchaeales archaeon]